MISSEAGHSMQSIAGDVPDRKKYENQLISEPPNSAVRPRRQAVKRGQETATTIYTACASIIHESIPDNYASIISNEANFADGTISRLNILFIEPESEDTKFNRESFNNKFSKDLIDILAQVATNCVIKGDIMHQKGIMTVNHAVKCEQSAGALLDEIEHRDHIEKCRAGDDQIARAMAVRRTTKIKSVARLLAVIDDPVNPTITLEHVAYADTRQQLIERTMMAHIEGGFLAPILDQTVSKFSEYVRRYLGGKLKIRPSSAEKAASAVNGGDILKGFQCNHKSTWTRYRNLPANRFRSPEQLKDILLQELCDLGVLREMPSKNMHGVSYSAVKYAGNRKYKDYKVLCL
jgi:hypothetical protein